MEKKDEAKKQPKYKNRVDRIFAQHPEYKELYFVDEGNVFSTKKAAKESGLKFKTLKRK